MNAEALHPNRPNVRTPLLIVLLALGGLALITMLDHLPRIQAPLSAHAVAQHGDDAAEAKKCTDGEQAGFLFFNPRSQRWAVACWLGDRWGIVILTAAWLVITAYVTTKLKNVDRMRRYMERQGYEER
jgi:hypothetical protein